MPEGGGVVFADRQDAGVRLAERLRGLAGAEEVVVLGLPRGGVPVAFEIARALGAPLDVIVVRKLGVPFQPELGFGAVGEGGIRVVNQDIVRLAQLTYEETAEVEERQRAEVLRRASRLRGDRAPADLTGRTAIVVDDGVATGGTARVACQAARARGASRVVLAVPVGTPDTIESLREVADEVVCLRTPEHLLAVGAWYVDFAQTTDEQVASLLRRAAPGVGEPDESTASNPPCLDEEVLVDAGRVRLPGQLVLPGGASGVVVFVHGSGSSRHSPRNRHVAAVLNDAGLGTLLFDLLTPEEGYDRGNVFDIGLLAERLIRVTAWLGDQPWAAGVPVGYFGASTGAAAALWAAAEPGCEVAAIVSRGGRPDLAWPRLTEVRAATLLIVGGDDRVVLDLNRAARGRLHGESMLRIITGATHLFEEPGALERVAVLARDWFTGHFGSDQSDL
ncbi:phosphoribosyltransferase [Streptosporangium sp. NBC_01755]|uniref:phosphoribosyltransferase n=1 Tax=unclassified Streptosporangium TaxID=2632669 RepID=UPI002DD889BA|nr:MULTISPECIES: phosphoribosyltransferase [unclassified Streptosporangium]WSA28703.1 phosphoribosyltransferase [Streptosporangium sp. NBC_01810]WSC99844.1 phosphoribosyltransferase [Streptosporangium sp. NBC_01755]